MRDNRQYFASAVSFPGTAARFKVVSAPENIRTLPSTAKQGHAEGDDRRRYEAQQRRGVPVAIETRATGTGAIAGENKAISSRPGRLLAPPFGIFLRAALLAHLRRTFR